VKDVIAPPILHALRSCCLFGVRCRWGRRFNHAGLDHGLHHTLHLTDQFDGRAWREHHPGCRVSAGARGRVRLLLDPRNTKLDAYALAIEETMFSAESANVSARSGRSTFAMVNLGCCAVASLHPRIGKALDFRRLLRSGHQTRATLRRSGKGGPEGAYWGNGRGSASCRQYGIRHGSKPEDLCSILVFLLMI